MLVNIYNIIPRNYNDYLKSILLDPKFPWNFWVKAIPDCLKKTNRVDSKEFINPTQLKHVFLNKVTKSEYYKCIEPLIEFYKKASNREVVKVHAAAVIMQHPVKELTNITPHVDFDYTEFTNTELVTLVYYVTQANGGTTIYNEFCTDKVIASVTALKYIPTVENLLIEFNSNRFHSGVEPTDDIRIVLTVILEVKNENI